MFFLNPKKVKAENPTPKWFSGLMLLFFAFVVYRALYPADVPQDEQLSAGDRLLEEMPSLKRVVTGETFEPATQLMEQGKNNLPKEAEPDVLNESAGEDSVVQEEIIEPITQAGEVAADSQSGSPLRSGSRLRGNDNVASFTLRATNGKGQPIDLMYEKGEGSALHFGKDASHTIIIPPQNGQEMRVITIKRVD